MGYFIGSYSIMNLFQVYRLQGRGWGSKVPSAVKEVLGPYEEP